MASFHKMLLCLLERIFLTTKFLSVNHKNVRFYFVTFAMFILYCVMIWRVLDLSYFGREKYLKSLKNIRKLTNVIHARRGNILDRNLEVLALDEKKITIGVDPYAANVDNDIKKICSMAEMLNIDAKKVIEKFDKKQRSIGGKLQKIRWEPICEINIESLYSAINSLKIRGVYGIRDSKRLYPFGSKTSHITGFINHENMPICGIEKFMDAYLRGRDGQIESERDGRSGELVKYRNKEIPKRDGCDVVLTIDKNIQCIVFDEIQDIIKKFNPQSVSIIVSEAQTGEILALANYPDYDPNDYGKFPIENMKNLAVSNVYEPGSVFKIVAMSFGIEYGLVDEDTIFDCSKSTAINRGKTINLPNDHSQFGKLTFVDAVRKSSNRAAAQIAMMIGEEQFYDCVRNFGFGEKAGYGFDAESKGILWPTNKWDALTITRLPMGHAIGVVPLQTHCAMSVIANDGVLTKPLIIKKILNGREVILENFPEVKRQVLSQETAVRMRKVMHNPENGKLPCGVTFGGKSGTGQKIINGKYSHEHHTSSYSGFFPVDTPKIVVTVIIDDAHRDYGIAWGSTVSLPSFKNISEKIAQYLDL